MNLTSKIYIEIDLKDNIAKHHFECSREEEREAFFLICKRLALYGEVDKIDYLKRTKQGKDIINEYQPLLESLFSIKDEYKNDESKKIALFNE
jgi:hypothetical protein